MWLSRPKLHIKSYYNLKRTSLYPWFSEHTHKSNYMLSSSFLFVRSPSLSSLLLSPSWAWMQMETSMFIYRFNALHSLWIQIDKGLKCYARRVIHHKFSDKKTQNHMIFCNASKANQKTSDCFQYFLQTHLIIIKRENESLTTKQREIIQGQTTRNLLVLVVLRLS